MRPLSWFPLLLAGCGFRIGAGSAPDDARIDASDAPGDTRIDAAIDAAIDARMIDAPMIDASMAGLCNASDPNLRACFTFENTLVDGSMYANSGGGPASYTNVNGHSGQALNANGSAVTVPGATSLNVATFTLDMWIRPNALPAVASSRMGLLDNSSYRMFLLPGGGVRCAINDGARQVLAMTGVTANTWTRVSCTYDVATLKIYINGVLVAAALSNDGVDALSTNTTIGRQEPLGDTFNGLIDDVRIFSGVQPI